tara:strand:- start:764 stop:1033 length:270 start_codon:yes stop_codon:yes gene_type:complete
MKEFDPDNLPDFTIPETFLNQLYEFTGGEDIGKGFILSFVDDSGRALVYNNSSSQIVDMGLRKALEKYLVQIEEQENSMNNMDGLDEIE